MGCGCGKKFTSPTTANRSQAQTSQRVVASSPIPPQVQQAMYAKRTVQSQPVPQNRQPRRAV